MVHPCIPRYARLGNLTWTHHVNHAVVSFMDFFGITPKGMKEVHLMLVLVAKSLIAGGKTGVFSPMHMLLFRKPGQQRKP